ncbi:MAG: ribosomal protein L11P -lysine N-methyltransferase [Alphaproteobacteria bacterium]|nr:ribosomal protein L11P -lysine N-methyltransferase [Alphaproteobacteria bacterium]
MHGYSVTFPLSKKDWHEVEPALSELFEALIVKPERENDPTSREVITLIFEKDPKQDLLQEQINYVFEASDVLHPPRIAVEKLPDIDWLQKVYEDLKPIDAGRFFVHGSHITANIPTDKVTILIEAATAFGTGEHPTTKACLLLFDRLLDGKKQPKKILDMGCGSGILAIAAARTLPVEETRIIGVDIDPQSVHVASNHASDNKVDHDITFVAGDGFKTPIVREEGPYDLVFANILAQPLIDMAGDLAAIAGRDVLLSGFTTEQKSYVLKPYAQLGFVEQDEIVIDEWVGLWLKKK